MTTDASRPRSDPNGAESLVLPAAVGAGHPASHGDGPDREPGLRDQRDRAGCEPRRGAGLAADHVPRADERRDAEDHGHPGDRDGTRRRWHLGPERQERARHPGDGQRERGHDPRQRGIEVELGAAEDGGERAGGRDEGGEQ